MRQNRTNSHRENVPTDTNSGYDMTAGLSPNQVSPDLIQNQNFRIGSDWLFVSKEVYPGV